MFLHCVPLNGVRSVSMTTMSLQQKEDEVNQLKQETARLNKLRDTVHRKLRLVEDQKGECDQQRDFLKNQIIALERGTAY